MERKAKVTTIEKKYKDKKTGEWKSTTIHYSKVNDRLLEFRQDCPHGDIDTIVSFPGNGKVLVKAVIIKDRAEFNESARATAHAVGSDDSEKGLEKTETLAVGRALAILGYGADGAIASSEEMDEFLEHKAEIKNSQQKFWEERIESAGSMDELKKTWAEMPPEFKTALNAKKLEMKKVLTNEVIGTEV